MILLKRNNSLVCVNNANNHDCHFHKCQLIGVGSVVVAMGTKIHSAMEIPAAHSTALNDRILSVLGSEMLRTAPYFHHQCLCFKQNQCDHMELHLQTYQTLELNMSFVFLLHINQIAMSINGLVKVPDGQRILGF